MSTEEQDIKEIFNKTGIRYMKNNEYSSPLNNLKDRWVSLIRNHGFKLVEYSKDKGDTICSPDLFDIANEIEAFFTGLNSK